MSLPDHNIALSKAKIIGLLAGSILFVLVGIVLVLRDPAEIAAGGGRYSNPAIVHTAGWLGIGFFGLCAVFITRKLFDHAPGLRLSAAGLYDNASGISAGLIPWSDIAGFAPYQVSGQHMVVILLKDPEPYIERGSAFRRKLNRVNYKMCGSPVVISANALRTKLPELQILLDQYFMVYGTE